MSVQDQWVRNSMTGEAETRIREIPQSEADALEDMAFDVQASPEQTEAIIGKVRSEGSLSRSVESEFSAADPLPARTETWLYPPVAGHGPRLLEERVEAGVRESRSTCECGVATGWHSGAGLVAEREIHQKEVRSQCESVASAMAVSA